MAIRPAAWGVWVRRSRSASIARSSRRSSHATRASTRSSSTPTRSSPTVTNATASTQGGKDLGQSVGAFINAVIGLVDPNAGGPSQVTLPLVSSTLTAIQNQTGLPLTSLSLAADVAVSAVLPQTLAQIEANTALTSTTPVTIQTSVTANPDHDGQWQCDGQHGRRQSFAGGELCRRQQPGRRGHGRLDHRSGDYTHGRRAESRSRSRQRPLPERDRDQRRVRRGAQRRLPDGARIPSR